MIIGIPKEIKDSENRVAAIPATVHTLASRGHTVLVQEGAGAGSGISDAAYESAGSKMVYSASEVFENAELILKVKEPLASEYPLLRPGQILFTYLHLAADKNLTRALSDRRIVGIAYETIETADGRLPLLEPMSEVAGRMAVHIAAMYLSRPLGGRGVLMGGVPGVPPATVVILGGGIVGYNAARVAAGMGAWVYLLEKNPERLLVLKLCAWIDRQGRTKGDALARGNAPGPGVRPLGGARLGPIGRWSPCWTSPSPSARSRRVSAAPGTSRSRPAGRSWRPHRWRAIFAGAPDAYASSNSRRTSLTFLPSAAARFRT